MKIVNGFVCTATWVPLAHLGYVNFLFCFVLFCFCFCFFFGGEGHTQGLKVHVCLWLTQTLQLIDHYVSVLFNFKFLFSLFLYTVTVHIVTQH